MAVEGGADREDEGASAIVVGEDGVRLGDGAAVRREGRQRWEGGALLVG